MEFKVLSVLKKFMSEEAYTAFEKGEEFEKALNVDIAKYITANSPTKDDVMAEAQKGIITQLGIDGETIDDIKLYVKKLGGSTDEIKEANLKLEKQYKELEAKYNGEVESRTKLENEAKDVKQTNLIKGLGITDEKQIEFFKWDFNRQVTDEKDFAKVVEEYAKENDVKTTTRFVKDDFGAFKTTNELDIGEAWKAKRAKTRKTN